MNFPRFQFFQPSRLRWLQRSGAFSFFLGTIFALATLTRAAEQSTDGTGADSLGPFFEPHFPFYQSAVELPATASGKEQIVVRGILLPMPNGLCVLFDQELLRVAAIWKTEPGAPWITLRNMAQVSYAEMHRKAGKDRPAPVGGVLIQSDALPGVAATLDALAQDPRAASLPGESGRGPLPPAQWRYEGITLTSQTATVRYRTGQTPIREWFTPGACEESVLRI